MSHSVRLPRIGTFDAWRDAARKLAAARVPPDQVDWGLDGEPAALFDAPLPDGLHTLSVPRAFLDLSAELVPERAHRGMAIAYALLVRLQDEPGLLGHRADPDVARARDIARAVRRDIHKMKAFVRFRQLPSDTGRRRFAAWFEPGHRIEERAARFFADRFGDMDWLIQTPEVSILFEGGHLRLTAEANQRPRACDDIEQLWTTYYAHIFNPARLKTKAMRAEMPKKYWHNLPEAALIPDLIAGAAARASNMRKSAPTEPSARAAKILRRRHAQAREPARAATTLDALARQAAACTRCPLHACATQTVFGEGPADASVMVVGEQPGDQEDLAGRPFVGPAGRLFAAEAERARLDRAQLYVTNAVKHFKFSTRGNRRIHQRPNAGEIDHCRWWLDRERALIRPKLIVAMGATALKSVTGDGAGILERKGRIERADDGTPVLPTVHPSYLLRVPDPHVAERETALFREHLRAAAAHLGR